jgi:glycosyltransferase involved in cell wall biosynthesis
MGCRVSVIVPTYNRRAFLEAAVESVLDQTYTEFELIVVDGGSTDGTRSYLQAITDDRLEVIDQGGPHGISHARNLGLEAASGQYILLLDDDDRLLKDAISVLVNTLREQPQTCGGVFTAHRKVEGSNKTGEHRVMEGRVTQFENASIGGPSCVLLRKAVVDRIGLFDESFPAGEDVDFWIRLFSAFDMYALDRILYERRCHEDQISKDVELMLAGQKRIVKKHANTLSSTEGAQRHYNLAINNARLGNLEEARANVRRAVQLHPLRKGPLYYCVWLHMGSLGYRVGAWFHHQVYRPMFDTLVRWRHELQQLS